MGWGGWKKVEKASQAQHDMSCTHPPIDSPPASRPLARLNTTASRGPLRPPPSRYKLLPRFLQRCAPPCVYIWKILPRPPSNKLTRALHTYPAASLLMSHTPRVWKADAYIRFPRRSHGRLYMRPLQKTYYYILTSFAIRLSLDYIT